MYYGIFLSFLAYACLAAGDAFVKILGGTLSSVEVAFYGSLLGLIVLPFIKKTGVSWRDSLRTRHPRLWLLRTLTATIGTIGSITAFTYLPMAEAFALIFLLPIYVTIFSVLFLSEEAHWRRWSAVVLGFLGVVIVLRPGFRELSVGHLGAFLAGAGGAISIIIFRIVGKTEQSTSLYMSGILGPIVICGLLMLPHHVRPTVSQWWLLLGYGLGTAFASVLLMRAAGIVPATYLAVPQYSQMIWALILGYLFFAEKVDAPMMVGSALIIASSVFTVIRQRQVKIEDHLPSDN